MTFPSCQSFSNFMSTTSFWGSFSHPLCCVAPGWSCLCPASARGSCSYLLPQLSAEGWRLMDEPHCRPAPIRTWFAFNCTSGVGILVWEAKSFGTVTRPNPSLLALQPLMAFPHFTWDRALKCIFQTWPTPFNVCWGSFSHWFFCLFHMNSTPWFIFFFNVFFFFLQQRKWANESASHAQSGKSTEQPGSHCRGLAPRSGMSTCR